MGLRGIGVGAMIGGIMQLVVAMIGVWGLNFKWARRINFKSMDFRRILRQLPARSLDQGIDSVNSIVETNRARNIGEGVISHYENAYILHSAPILLIGSSISTAAFPRLAERLASKRPDLFRKDFNDVLRVLLWLTFPVVVVTFFTRGYLARLIFKDGSPEIATLLMFLSIAILFRVIYSLFSRYFYSHKDTFTPLIISVFAIALNIILVFALTRKSSYGFSGLAIAQAIVSGVEVLVIGVVMLHRDPALIGRKFWDMLVRLMSATGFTIISAFVMMSIFPLLSTDKGFFVLGGKLLLIVSVILGTHVVVTAAYGFGEARNVLKTVRNIAFSSVRIHPK